VTGRSVSHTHTRLNNNPKIHAILVQLPIPNHINKYNVLNQIDLKKDVDGFNPINVGNLMLNKHSSIPCTPLACLEILKQNKIQISGKHVVILGRSNIVGLPLAMLLLHENATISICHSKTENIKEITQKADILHPFTKKWDTLM
jgi:methylenetetrahydrofolate dehydrogenase (NADP+)/methenyltetrahydrofolate cyclohydrolase